MSSAPRFLGVGLALGLAAGLLVGVGLSQPTRAAAASPSTTSPVGATGGLAIAPGALPFVMGGTTSTQVSAGSAQTGSAMAQAGTGSAQAASAIAYPWFGGSPGLAPEHTIVVTGVGQAVMKPDGSDLAGAQNKALAAALADAKAQADAIASATGLAISGVYSVSASSAPFYGVMPMAGVSSGSAPGQAGPPVAQPMDPQPDYPQTLSVSVTVAYRVG